MHREAAKHTHTHTRSMYTTRQGTPRAQCHPLFRCSKRRWRQALPFRLFSVRAWNLLLRLPRPSVTTAFPSLHTSDLLPAMFNGLTLGCRQRMTHPDAVKIHPFRRSRPRRTTSTTTFRQVLFARGDRLCTRANKPFLNVVAVVALVVVSVATGVSWPPGNVLPDANSLALACSTLLAGDWTCAAMATRLSLTHLAPSREDSRPRQMKAERKRLQQYLEHRRIALLRTPPPPKDRLQISLPPQEQECQDKTTNSTLSERSRDLDVYIQPFQRCAARFSLVPPAARRYRVLKTDPGCGAFLKRGLYYGMIPPSRVIARLRPLLVLHSLRTKYQRPANQQQQ